MLQEDDGEQFEEITVASSKSAQKEDDVKYHTELAIKHLRLTPASATEQHEELLQFITRKEHKVRELREELARHEEELRLLKLQWQREVTKDWRNPHLGRGMHSDSSDSDGPYLSSSDDEGDLEDYRTSNAEDDIKRFVTGLGRGIRGVLGEIQKVAESEKTQGTISSIKTAVNEVKESDRFKETKQKTVDFTTTAWGSISRKFSALANSDAFASARRRTAGTANDAEHNSEYNTERPLAVTPMPSVRQPPPLPAKRASTDAGPSKALENVQPYQLRDGRHQNDKEKYEVVVAGLADSPELLTSSSHVIGEDPDLDLDVELEFDKL